MVREIRKIIVNLIITYTYTQANGLPTEPFHFLTRLFICLRTTLGKFCTSFTLLAKERKYSKMLCGVMRLVYIILKNYTRKQAFIKYQQSRCVYQLQYSDNHEYHRLHMFTMTKRFILLEGPAGELLVMVNTPQAANQRYDLQYIICVLFVQNMILFVAYFFDRCLFFFEDSKGHTYMVVICRKG